MGLQFQALSYPLCLMLAIGCASQPDFDSVYTRLELPTLQTGNPIPQPQTDVILTVSGRIGTTNQDESIVMDIPTLKAVGLVEYTVQDPFEEVQQTFTGILMRDLLELWQASPEATTIEVTALNDYQVDIPIDLMQNYPVILALKQDGEYMTPNYRGPTMLVFPYDDYRFDATEIDNYWVWQIKSISVK